jgi:hypothetical protein
MIRARGHHPNGREFILFGLSHENLDRLRDGSPIAFDGTPYGVPMEIVIVAGETEKEIAEGLIGPETTVKAAEDNL